MAEKTKEQMVDEVWAKYDTDNSGILEKAEAMSFLRDTFKEIFGSQQTDQQLQGTFDMIDKNKTNTIDKKELQAHIKGIIDGEADIDD